MRRAASSLQRTSTEQGWLQATLFEHLHRNVVRLGRTFYLQRTGIPQGSVLSTLLCCLFYAHMVRHIQPSISCPLAAACRCDCASSPTADE